MKWCLLLLIAFTSHLVCADDIELYIKQDVAIKQTPKVMVIFDTSGSMAFSSTNGNNCGYDYVRGRYYLCPDNRLGVAKQAITDLINGNPDIDFGLMRFNQDQGGYILAGLGASNYALRYQISALEAIGSTPLTESLWEAYEYLSGGNVGYGYGVPWQYRDTSVERGNRYISPFQAVANNPDICASSASIIMITDGEPSADDGSNYNIANLYYSTFAKSAEKLHDSYLPALAEIIAGKKDLYPQSQVLEDKGRVYTIGFGTDVSQKGTEVLQKAAQLGKGIYTQANTPNELTDALKKQLDVIRQVNDSFSAPSVATSSSDQTRSGEALYYTMFHPEPHTRWQGNLKKLKFSNNKVVDMGGAAALDEKGLIAASATTFWSESGSQDGNNIQRGGVNYQLQKQRNRTIYSDYGNGSLRPFTVPEGRRQYGNLRRFAGALGVYKNEVKNTINWLYGWDVDDDDRDGVWRERRLDIFGDPLHSKPVTMDYGNGDIRVIVGTNAGLLHMFKDKGNTVEESWAFIPESLFKVIYNTRVKKPDTKLYGMDGPLTVYFHDVDQNGKVNGDDEVWLFAGMRRGGNRYYAFDITDPDNPEMMWGKPLGGGSGTFEELNQSWSKPEVTYIENRGKSPVLIFGAGYDTNKDNGSSVDGKGRGIFIIDAQTGSLVWSLTPKNGFKGKHSVPGDVAMLDSNYDGYTDRLYFADTGGDVWRVDMPGANPTDNDKKWTHFKLAQLGQPGGTGDRRFFYKPAVARTYFSKVTVTSTSDGNVKTRKDTPYEAVMLGSGNRSRPLSTGTKDYLVMIRDEHTVTQSFQTNVPSTIQLNELMDITQDPFAAELDNVRGFTDVEAQLGQFKGWKYALSGNEKSLAAPTVAGGIAYFTSYTPPSEVSRCKASTGTGNLYAFHLHYGTQVYDELRFETTHTVPDTPKVYFNCEKAQGQNDCETVVRMVGPAIKTEQDKSPGNGPSTGTPWTPSELLDSVPVVINGKISLTRPQVDFGLTTRQMYIYKKELNDEK